MKRYLTDELTEHFSTHRQMLFLSGPRQVGKTTIARGLCERSASPETYLNWDNQDHRALVVSGPEKVAEHREILTLALSTEAEPSFAELAAQLRERLANREHTPAETLQRDGRDER